MELVRHVDVVEQIAGDCPADCSETDPPRLRIGDALADPSAEGRTRIQQSAGPIEGEIEFPARLETSKHFGYGLCRVGRVVGDTTAMNEIEPFGLGAGSENQ